MTRIKLALLAALIGASTAVMADDPQSDAARQQRMDEALHNYRDHHEHESSSGTFERTENAIKRGARKTGHAIEHGAKKVGHAVSNGVEKAAGAVRRTGEKIGEKVDPK